MKGRDTLQRQRGRLKRTAATLALCLLAACASGPAPQQTAERRNGDGIGGTGMSQDPMHGPMMQGSMHGSMMADGKKNGDGIGGTGILGTISGFGSIIVNGAAWEFDRHTAVETDGKPSSLEELKVGQVVMGVARPRGDKFYLDTLEIQHAVSGPITAIDYDGETMTVLGQTVRLNLAGDKTAMDAFRTLQAGDTVSVSGLRLADGTIIASRVDEQSDDDERILLRGVASDVNTSSLKVGDLSISVNGGTTVAPPTDGAPVFVSGRMINGQFTADVISGYETLAFGRKVQDVSLEGYAPATQSPLKVQGVAIEGATLPAGTAAGDRLVVTGHLTGNGTIAATAITKVRTVVTINAANGSLRPAAMRPDVRQRPERVAPRPAIDRPQSLDIPKPEVPERPQIERPQSVIPTS